MSISAVSNTTSIPMTSPATGDATAPATGSAKTLNVNDFLKLLAVQMNSQDPLNPTQDTQFIAQMASFTSLQQMKDLSASMTTFATNQTAANAQNYLGRNVTLLDPDQGTVSGVVSSVNFAEGRPLLEVNGQQYDPAYLRSVNTSSGAAAAPAPTTP